MTPISRRTAIQALAGGTVAASTGVIARATPIKSAPSQTPSHVIPQDLLDQAMAIEPTCNNSHKGQVVLARLGLVRSSTRRVYLYAGPSLKGVVELDVAGHALACAAAAVGRAVFARVWGHDPLWANGVGRFEGAVLAFDAIDLLPPTSNNNQA
jgi:hypothetical protein